MVDTLKYIHSSIRLQSNLRISHRIRDLKGTSEVVNKETLYLNIKNPKHPVQDVHSKPKDFILN